MLPTKIAQRLELPVPMVRGNLDRLFEEFFRELPRTHAPQAAGGPPMSLWHDENAVYVEMELPGVAPEAIDVTVHNGQLQIRGQRNQVTEDRKGHVTTRTFGSFEQVVRLPEGIDPESVAAELDNGILTVAIKRLAKDQPRKVVVKATNPGVTGTTTIPADTATNSAAVAPNTCNPACGS